MRRLVLLLAVVIPIAFDGVLLAEILPEVLVSENKEDLGSNDIDRLTKEAKQAEEAGLYQTAIEIWEEVLEIQLKSFGSDHPEVATTLWRLAEAYQTSGNYKQSETTFLRALSIREKLFGANHTSTAEVLFWLGMLYEQYGLYDKAEEAVLRVLEIEEGSLGKRHHYVATTLNGLGRIYMKQGFEIKAEKSFLRGISIREKYFGRNHRKVAIILVELATLYQSQERYKEAETLLKRVIKIEETTSHEIDPFPYISIGDLYQEQGEYEKAEKYFLKALKIYQNALGKDHDFVALGLIMLGSLYMEQGKFEKANKSLIRALSIKEKAYGTTNLEVANVLHWLALLHKSKGDFDNAINFQYRNIEMLLTVIQKEAPNIPFNDRYAFTYSIDNDFPDVFSNTFSGDDQKKLALFLRLNRQGLLEEIEKRQLKMANLIGSHRDIEEELRVLTQRLASIKLTEVQRKKLIARKEELERKLFRALPELKPRIIEVEKVAKIIPLKGVLVEYQKYVSYNLTLPDEEYGKERYLALTLKANGVIKAFDLGLAEAIESKIHKALLASEQGLPDAQNLWNELSESIIKPLEELIDDSETLFISPDAELNRIPFAALSSHKDDQLLVDSVKIRLLTTGRELLDLAKRSKSSKQKPLVVANPAFNLIKNFRHKKESELIASNTSQQRSGDLGSFIWSPLPGTEKEGKVVAELTKAQLLTKKQATALALQEKKAPKVLHIASHAYFEHDQKKVANEQKQPNKGIDKSTHRSFKGENPLLRSGIVLAGANKPEANPKDDGYLTALEVTKLDWQGTDLAVISGCESGKGDIQSGEGVYGLKRAIAVAGARSSLLSLWKVDDRATAAFMTSFYKKLKAGEGRADALDATQKEFRNHSIPGWRHPYVWAAFQLSGDWRPIKW